MLQLYTKDEGGRNWVKSSIDSSNLKYDSGSVLSVFPEMCSQGRHTKLSDFDDHLNDLSRSVMLLLTTTLQLFGILPMQHSRGHCCL